MLDSSAVIRRYMPDNNGGFDEVHDFAEVDAGDGEVDLHISPRSDDVVTVSMSAGQAWLLARALARAASDIERDD